MRRLFLVDGSALAYRSFFALGRTALTTAAGEPSGAVLGFSNTIWQLIRDHRPEYLAVVFDTRAPTFRHQAYEAYKATRQKMPEELSVQYPRIHEFVETYPIVLLRQEGVEADDIIGSYAARLAGPDLEVVMVSGDKDFCQVVTEHVKILNPGRGGPSGREAHWLGPDGVVERFGVPPSRVVDVLALMGDSSDNVPGVPGIGEKTASALIQEFGSLEQLYDALDKVGKKGVREKLAEHRELAFLSKTLVTIRTDLDLPKSLDELRMRPPSRELVHFFREMEFGRLMREAEIMIEGATPETPKEAGPAEPKAKRPPPRAGAENLNLFETSAEEPPPDAAGVWRILTDDQDLARLAGEIRAARGASLAVELDGPDPMRAGLLGLGIAAGEGPAAYIPIGHAEAENVPLEQVRRRLEAALQDPGVVLSGHDLKPALLALDRHGMRLPPAAFDTGVASYLVDAERLHDLPRLARAELGVELKTREEILGRGARRRSPKDLTPAEAASLAAAGAGAARDLATSLEQDLRERELRDLFTMVEMPLLEVLRHVEETGITVDAAFLAAMSERMNGEIAELERRAHEAAGEPFNLNSPPQLGRILFERLGLRKARRTKTGYSTDSDVLEELAGAHPLPALILEHRQLVKLKSTYVDALPRLVHPDTGRVHTSFNQMVAATGRLSSSNPNLQNIPIRTPLGREVRRAFIAAPGFRLISADYSQVELRIMAHISGDERLTDYFHRDVDVHRETAASLFGVPPAVVTPEQRSSAKTVNFGIMYGQGAVGLARQIGVPRDEAGRFIAAYRAQFPGVDRFLKSTIAEGVRLGYVTTLLKRRRYLPNLNSAHGGLKSEAERMAINTPIQGTAADLIKVAMVRVHRELGADFPLARLLLTVHDELLLEAPSGVAIAVGARVKSIMESAMALSVPIVVDVGVGADWASIH